MSIAIDENAADASSRLALVSLVMLNLRLMENWRSFQMELWGRSLDSETTMILLAVIAIAGEKLTRADLPPEWRNLKNVIPAHALTKCNASSIAAATGLNRETVRRRVGKLTEQSILVKNERGGLLIAPEVVQSGVVEQVVRAQLESLRSTMAQLERAGLLIAAAESTHVA